MFARFIRSGRVALILSSSFIVGAGSAEVALRTSTAVARVRAERETGAAGQLVQLELSSFDGEVLARPRIIAPVGKTAQLVLHDPARPGAIRLALRVQAARDEAGLISLEYVLFVPDRAIATKGKLSLTPGVQQAMELGDGALVASFLAVPVPSAAFDDYLQTDAASWTPGKAS